MRRYFITKIEQTADGKFKVTARPQAEMPGEKVRGALTVTTDNASDYSVGAEVRPVFEVR